MKQNKITAVVVTYNRFSLLKEVIAALHGQTVKPAEIIIVNNGSTDETAAWLDVQKELVVIHQKNSGGAGGFYSGIQQAVLSGADYVWVMDDDTICAPAALEILLGKLVLAAGPVGFLCSRCNWTDGMPHLMNIPGIKSLYNNHIPFNKYDEHNILLAESASFVSLLISSEAVNAVGLPYRDFFIWGDDHEYTQRITRRGFNGFYCPGSIVLHKTAANGFTDFYNDSVQNIWKHRHGFRNEFYLVKKNKGMLYFLAWLPAKLVWASVKVIRTRKADHYKFIRALFGAAREAVFFNPKIDMVSTLPAADLSPAA